MAFTLVIAYRLTSMPMFQGKMLCFECVAEPYLHVEIRGVGRLGECSYCGRTAKCISIGDLSERVEKAFAEHFTRTPTQPDHLQRALLADSESTYEWERSGQPVIDAIENALEMPRDAAVDVQQLLESRFSDFEAKAMGDETEFSSESYYEEKAADDWGWQEEWKAFERSLKTESRFFSKSGAEHLASIFDGIDALQTHSGRSLVVNAGPGTKLESLFRARAFQAHDKLKVALIRPDKHVGSPPPDAATAGRMNARGISVFYGSSSPEVALSEVRPPVGSQVAVAQFEIIRPLRLLDLTALSDVVVRGSIFDASWLGRLERAAFLRNLGRRMTVPVMPDDEVFDYLPTQAIADFLANENTPSLDGIIFPSIQAANGALNIVLFHKAARVEKISLPVGTIVSVSPERLSDDEEYFVSEAVPDKRKRKSKEPPSLAEMIFNSNGALVTEDFDNREVALRVKIETVTVHIVQRVNFTTLAQGVRRHRWVNRPPRIYRRKKVGKLVDDDL